MPVREAASGRHGSISQGFRRPGQTATGKGQVAWRGKPPRSLSRQSRL